MIKPNVTIKNAQQAQAAIRKALEAFTPQQFVTVGVHESAGDHDDSELSNAQILALNEFGTANMPARPSLQPGVKSGNVEYLKIVEDTVADGEPLEMALNKIGVVAVGNVQKYMTELRTPPNAASTIKQKKSSNPLIDTGQLRQSVTFSITNKKPQEGI